MRLHVDFIESLHTVYRLSVILMAGHNHVPVNIRALDTVEPEDVKDKILNKISSVDFVECVLLHI